MIERKFATNFTKMLETTSITKHGVGKRSIAIIPYFKQNVYILQNYDRDDLVITLEGDKVIKTRSKYFFSLVNIIKVQTFTNSAKGSSQQSFESTYVDDAEDKLIDVDFPRINAEDNEYLNSYFINNSEYYVPPEENSEYLFRIPVSQDYQKLINELNGNEPYFRTVRLPRSYSQTEDKGSFIYTNNIFCVKAAVNKVQFLLKSYKPKEIEDLKKRCMKQLEVIKSTIPELDDSPALANFAKDLEQAWVNYQTENYG